MRLVGVCQSVYTVSSINVFFVRKMVIHKIQAFSYGYILVFEVFACPVLRISVVYSGIPRSYYTLVTLYVTIFMLVYI